MRRWPFTGPPSRSNAWPSSWIPVPLSSTSSVPAAVRTETHDVLPPYRTVVGPALASEPRVPQNVTCTATPASDGPATLTPPRTDSGRHVPATVEHQRLAVEPLSGGRAEEQHHGRDVLLRITVALHRVMAVHRVPRVGAQVTVGRTVTVAGGGGAVAVGDDAVARPFTGRRTRQGADRFLRRVVRTEF